VARVHGEDLGNDDKALVFLVGDVAVNGEVEGNGAPEVVPQL
jgi:hypothetical protein